MAFWIKWEKGLARKQEILQIAARLGIPPLQAAGALMLVMEWLDDNVTECSEDGHARVTLKSLSIAFIDTIAGLVGFGEAMVETDWLRVENGVLVFVNADRHNGKSAKSRMLSADRKRAERSRKSHAPTVTKKRHFSSLLKDRDHEGVQGENGASRTVIPLLLSTEPFREGWGRWLQHRREKKAPIAQGSQTEKMQLKTLEGWGEERAIAAIDYTIFKGWTGLREPDPNDKEYANHRTSNSRGFSSAPKYGITDK